MLERPEKKFTLIFILYVGIALVSEAIKCFVDVNNIKEKVWSILENKLKT